MHALVLHLHTETKRERSLMSSDAHKALAAQFGLNTEAGKLLLSLYGRKGYASAPDFRALPTRPLPSSRPRMRDLGAPAERARDPSEATFDRDAVAAVDAARPSVAPKPPTPPAPIEALGVQKRSKSRIAAAEALASARGDIVGPPLRPGRNADVEKRRLQAAFQFKGGKALPEGVAAPALEGPVPLALLGVGGARPGSSASGRRSGSGGGGGGGGAPAGGTGSLLQELRATHAAVGAAVDDAEAFMQELRRMGRATGGAEAEHALALQGQGRELGRLAAAIRAEEAAEMARRGETGGAPRAPPQAPATPAGAGGGGRSAPPPPRPFHEGERVGGGFRKLPHSPTAPAGAAAPLRITGTPAPLSPRSPPKERRQPPVAQE